MCLFGCAPSLVGCGQESASGVPAAGRIDVDGQPLSGAVVTFEPIGETTGPNASVAIWKGEFEVQPEAGLHGGNYRVRVSLLPPEVRSELPVDGAVELPPKDAVIDPAFDAQSQLTCELNTESDNRLQFSVRYLNRRR
jgi:hypothetical protein